MSKVVQAVMGDLVNLMDKPMAFFGHSVGAVVAFEVAEECVRRGCVEASQLRLGVLPRHQWTMT